MADKTLFGCYEDVSGRDQHFSQEMEGTGAPSPVCTDSLTHPVKGLHRTAWYRKGQLSLLQLEHLPLLPSDVHAPGSQASGLRPS